jgi:hypothetical protein
MEATPDYKILLELSQIKLAQFAEEYNSLVIAPGFVFFNLIFWISSTETKLYDTDHILFLAFPC